MDIYRWMPTLVPFKLWHSMLMMLLVTALAVMLSAGCASATNTPARPTVETFADLAPYAISMLSPSEGWVVGLKLPGPPNRVEELHYQGGRWTRVHLPSDVGGGYTGVAAVAPNDVWAVGGGSIVHYDGVAWRVVVSDQSYSPHGLVLEAIAMVSAQEGWAVGLGGLLHYTHGHWVDAHDLLPPRPADLYPTLPYPGMRAIDMLTPTNGWAVGDGGAIWHYDGARWQRVASPPLGVDAEDVALFSVRMVSPREGWAVGGAISKEFHNAAIIEHYTGGHWTIFSRPDAPMDGNGGGHPSLRTVTMVSALEGWAAGQQVHRTYQVNSEAPLYNFIVRSLLLHYASGRWSEVVVPDLGTINAITLVAPGEGWAAADGGLLHLHDGTWTAVVR